MALHISSTHHLRTDISLIISSTRETHNTLLNPPREHSACATSLQRVAMKRSQNVARALNNNKVYSRFLGRVGAIGTISASDSDDGEPVFLLRLADGEVSGRGGTGSVPKSFRLFRRAAIAAPGS